METEDVTSKTFFIQLLIACRTVCQKWYEWRGNRSCWQNNILIY